MQSNNRRKVRRVSDFFSMIVIFIPVPEAPGTVSLFGCGGIKEVEVFSDVFIVGIW